MDLRTGVHKPFMKPNTSICTQQKQPPTKHYQKHPRKHQQKTIKHFIQRKNIPKGNPTLPRRPQKKWI